MFERKKSSLKLLTNNLNLRVGKEKEKVEFQVISCYMRWTSHIYY